MRLKKSLLLCLMVPAIIGCKKDSDARDETKAMPVERAAWEKEVIGEIARLENLHSEWKENLIALEESGFSEDLTDAQFLAWLKKRDKATADRTLRLMNLTTSIRMIIFNIWEVTGSCQFSDMRCDELVKHVPVIVERYRKYMSDNAQLTIREMRFRGIEQCLRLLSTEYCWPALAIMEDYVAFVNPFIIAGVIDCVEIPPDSRKRIQEAMNTWFQCNKSHLRWNRQWGQFDRNGDTFELPLVVLELMEGVFP